MIKQGHELDLWNSSEQPEKKKESAKSGMSKFICFFFFSSIGRIGEKKSEHSNAKQFFLGPQNGREREKNFEFTEGC